MAKKNDDTPVTGETLANIREEIRKIDVQRRNPELSPKERELLEISAVTLRKAERIASAALQKQVTDEMADAVKDLKQQSSRIRGRVTRMGKVPTALDKVETVIGGVVSILKEISRWSFLLVFMAMTSCAVLTSSQVKMAEKLSIASDTATAGPSVIFENLAQVRTGRGLMYAATLTSPEAHLDEVTALSKQLKENEKKAQQAEAYIKALNSYCKSLSSLANEKRWKQYGTELRGIGRKTDSILFYINEVGWPEDKITVGFAKLSGRFAGLIAENYMKCRQAKAVKEYVTEADSLVSQCVDALVEALNSDRMKSLIENEKTALDDDYRAFLDAASLTPDMMSLALRGDALYMEYHSLLDDASTARTKCISALKTFSRAHSKLATNLRSRSDVSKQEFAEDIFTDILELNTLSAQIAQLVKKSKK